MSSNRLHIPVVQVSCSRFLFDKGKLSSQVLKHCSQCQGDPDRPEALQIWKMQKNKSHVVCDDLIVNKKGYVKRRRLTMPFLQF